MSGELIIGDIITMQWPEVAFIADHYRFTSSATAYAAEMVLTGLVSAVADTAGYLSGPVTSGRLLLDAEDRGRLPQERGTNEYADAHAKLVLQPNVAHMKNTAARLRGDGAGSAIVLPCAVNVPKWREGDYMQLWLTFIACYATKVFVMPDWELSSGASAEVAMAVTRKLPVVDVHNGQTLPVAMTTAMVARAMDHYGTRLPQHPWIHEAMKAACGKA